MLLVLIARVRNVNKSGQAVERRAINKLCVVVGQRTITADQYTWPTNQLAYITHTV